MRKLSKYKLVRRKRIKYKKMLKLKIRKTTGFHVKPKNNVSYDGIEVKELVILKKRFIANLLKKKIKRKLDLYLDLIIDDTDTDTDTSASSYKEHLDSLSRFMDIIKYKYKKFLDKKYTNLLIKKIELLEYELKEKIMDNYLDYETDEKEVDPVVYDYYEDEKVYEPEELYLEEEELTNSHRHR
jgi:hypothetical protein